MFLRPYNIADDMLQWLVKLCLSADVAADIIIASTLCVLLFKRRTGFRKSVFMLFKDVKSLDLDPQNGLYYTRPDHI